MDDFDVGLLCYGAGGRLAHRHDDRPDGGHLVYRMVSVRAATIVVSWPDDNKDLDLMAYWTARPDATSGWSHGEGANQGVYLSRWSGDDTSYGGSESFDVAIAPDWETAPRTFRIHFNYYGPVGGSATCTVEATGTDGVTVTRKGQRCSAESDRCAEKGDPYCTVEFDDAGRVVSIS